MASEPSKAAMRAAIEFAEAGCHLPINWMAGVIDRETHLPEFLEVAKRALVEIRAFRVDDPLDIGFRKRDEELSAAIAKVEGAK